MFFSFTTLEMWVVDDWQQIGLQHEKNFELVMLILLIGLLPSGHQVIDHKKKRNNVNCICKLALH